VAIDVGVILESASALDSAWCAPAGAARLVLRCDGVNHAAHLDGPAGRIRTWNDPLDALSWLSSSVDSAQPGRWIGFLSYDLVRLFEQLPARAADDPHIPLFAFTWHDASSVAGDVDETISHGGASAKLISSTFTRDEYLAAVSRAMEYIRAGDIFQANLSQRFTVATSECPAAIYRRLQHLAPANYAALLDHGDFALASNSPELFFRIAPGENGGRSIVTRPIKGTRPRRPGADDELARSVKDQAELNMIIDVERNDLGRICEIGSVKVSQGRTIEAHPTVYHGVAGISGTLRREVDFVEILRAMFPTGSITGAPKIRAMQIIDELEPVRRGAYCGAIGYLDSRGIIEFNVAIRTIVFAGGRAHISVGGGIVADSSPADEYEETLVKARALFAALGLSASGAVR
jgi:anthranilate/para-aminobenzoate synthase component I